MITEVKLIISKSGLLNLAEGPGNVLQACKVMGQSRETFYCFREFYDIGGELALLEISRGRPILRNRAKVHIEAALKYCWKLVKCLRMKSLFVNN